MNILVKKQVELMDLMIEKEITSHNQLYCWFLKMKGIKKEDALFDLQIKENILREEIKALKL
jgi:hypothetical protein